MSSDKTLRRKRLAVEPDSRRPRSAATTLLGVLLVVGLFGGAACSSESDVARPDDSGVVEITAVDDNTWEPEEIAIPAGEQVTIRVDNVDEGVSHNIVIRDLLQGDVESPLTPGPDVREIDLVVGEPGEYEFDCEIHPNMTGVLTVEGP